MKYQIDLPPQYCVGHENIDKQHSELLSIMKGISDGLGTKKHPTDTVLFGLINDLRLYTKSHFGYEEHIMKRAAYPDLETHKRLHQFFIEKTMEVHTLSCRASNDKSDLMKSALTFLRDWFTNHILIEDKKVVAHLKGHDLSTPSVAKAS